MVSSELLGCVMSDDPLCPIEQFLLLHEWFPERGVQRGSQGIKKSSLTCLTNRRCDRCAFEQFFLRDSQVTAVFQIAFEPLRPAYDLETPFGEARSDEAKAKWN